GTSGAAAVTCEVRRRSVPLRTSPMMKSLIIAVVSVLLSGCHQTARLRSSHDGTAERPAPAATDLASRSQEKRNAVAKLLRSSHKPPAKTKWTALVAGMNPGMTKTTVVEKLRPFGATAGMGAG